MLKDTRKHPKFSLRFRQRLPLAMISPVDQLGALRLIRTLNRVVAGRLLEAQSSKRLILLEAALGETLEFSALTRGMLVFVVCGAVGVMLFLRKHDAVVADD